MSAKPKRLTLAFYNLDNGRPDAVVNKEIGAILATRPAVFGGAEATGLRLGTFPEYHRVRDTSSRSRENIIMLVRKDLDFERGGWVDMDGTWPRTEGPGIHEARSYPWGTVEGQRVAIVHLEPNNARDADRLQAQSIDALAELNADITFGDFNGRRGEPGKDAPDALARRIRGRTVGGRIDCAVLRNRLSYTDLDYPTKVGKFGRRVRLAGDHGHAFTVTVVLPPAR